MCYSRAELPVLLRIVEFDIFSKRFKPGYRREAFVESPVEALVET